MIIMSIQGFTLIIPSPVFQPSVSSSAPYSSTPVWEFRLVDETCCWRQTPGLCGQAGPAAFPGQAESAQSVHVPVAAAGPCSGHGASKSPQTLLDSSLFHHWEDLLHPPQSNPGGPTTKSFQTISVFNAFLVTSVRAELFTWHFS